MGSQSAQNHHGVTELSWAQPEGDSEGESDPHLWAAHGRSCWELRAQHATAERGRQAWSSTATALQEHGSGRGGGRREAIAQRWLGRTEGALQDMAEQWSCNI